MSARVQRKFNNVVIKKQLKSQLLHLLLLPYFLMHFLAHVTEVRSTVPKETKKEESMALVVYLLNSVVSPNGRQ